MEGIFRTLLELMLYSAILLLCILAFQGLFRKQLSPRLRYLAWLVLVARLLVPFTLQSNLHLFAAPTTGEESTPALEPLFGILPLPDRLAYPPVEPPAPEDTQAAPAAQAEAPPATTTPTHTCSPLDIAVYLWAGAAALLLLGTALLQLRFARRLRRTMSPAPAYLEALAEDCRRQLGLRTPVRLRIQQGAGTPALTLSLRPTLLLPASMLQELPEEQLHLALLHETMHIRRGDHLVTLLLLLLRCIYWYNPVVWIARRCILLDMEAACDSQVAACLQPAQRTLYVHTLLALGSASPARHALGLQLPGGKYAMKRRITAMFQRNTSGRFARLGAACLIPALLLACFTTACQPAENGAILLYRNGSVPAAAPLDADTMAQIPALASPTPAATPARLQAQVTDSYPGAEAEVRMQVEAAIHYSSAPLPMLQARRHFFTMEEIRQYTTALFQGAPAFTPAIGMTKEQLQTEIDRTYAHIANETALIAYYNGDKETAMEVKAAFEARIRQYTALLENAPASLEQSPADWEFHPYADYYDTVIHQDTFERPEEDAQWIKASYLDSQAFQTVSQGNGQYLLVEARNLQHPYQDIHEFSFRKGSWLDGLRMPTWDDADTRPLTLSEDGAVSLCADLLSQMGVHNMQLAYIQPEYRRPLDATVYDETSTELVGYSLQFRPAYQGAPLLDGGGERSAFAQYFEAERLTMTIRNDTVVDLRWVSPMEVAVEGTLPAQMLSYEDALLAFRTHAQQAYTRVAVSGTKEGDLNYEAMAETLRAATLHIHQIELGYQLMRAPEAANDYIMVPAWRFYGWADLDYGDGFHLPQSNGLQCYFAINALTGQQITE